jgi:pyrroloquinoline quinone biosynthesis protein B
MAIRGCSDNWFLCNAGPDLGVQLRDWSAMSPRRDRPVLSHCVLLTDAELDHTSGLLSLRQADWLCIYGTATVRELLTECGLLPTLRSYTRVDWHDVRAGAEFELGHSDGSVSGLSCRAVEVGSGRLPRYARSTTAGADAVVGYVITDRRTGGSAAFAPSVAVEDELVVRALGRAGIAFIDGTFYEENEMASAGRGAAPISSMGHIPVNTGQLGIALASLGARVVYTHLNNTNQLILPESSARKSLVDRGFAIAHDGAEFAV